MKLVLVVEDDRFIRESLLELLQSEGYTAVGSENGQEALDYLDATSELPSIILLDLMMPIMDGWQFRKLQLQNSRIAHLPVVVLTADAKDKSILNVQGWIRKPITINEILGTVARLAI